MVIYDNQIGLEIQGGLRIFAQKPEDIKRDVIAGLMMILSVLIVLSTR